VKVLRCTQNTWSMNNLSYYIYYRRPNCFIRTVIIRPIETLRNDSITLGWYLLMTLEGEWKWNIQKFKLLYSYLLHVKNLPLHMQMNTTKLQTHQLLPIVIPWYITSKKGGKYRYDVTLRHVRILVPSIILVSHTRTGESHFFLLLLLTM